MDRQICTRIPSEYSTSLFNEGWEFVKLPLSVTLVELESRRPVFESTVLPHDWLICQGDDLYEDSSGWYRKYFQWEETEDTRLVLRFEGIYMDSTVYINRREACTWKYGYSTFEVDMTPYLTNGTNEILVRAAHQAPNSRWYSGAGIYRDVWLKVQHMTHLVSDGSYITIKELENGRWQVHARTEVALGAGEVCLGDVCSEDTCPGEHGKAGRRAFIVEYELWDMQTGEQKGFEGGETLSACLTRAEECRPACVTESEECLPALVTESKECWLACVTGEVPDPAVWDVKSPARYRIKVNLKCDGVLWQQEVYTVGFRTIEFSPERGFLLNGNKVKLNGVCEHHDLGCLGAAYNSSAMRRKLQILRKMGVNALRLSHNMPAPDVMELADELGFLIVSEAFDMWERPKTAYDYARFFREWYKKDVASWVRRDRNHPSLIMWSIGNEIYDTHIDERGQELTRELSSEVRLHDPDAHAGITIGSNYMPWENAQKCADIIKLAGYNYSEKYYDKHHQEHPDWIIYGSETSSTVQSRGIYHFPYEQSVLADEDEQCSALGNSTTSWGARSSESCIIAERDHEFSCGQFLWTGFDYIGEPTPYHTRNSYFGQVDTAGFPKDSYYIYQAEWTDYREAPMVHIFPYWDFNEGQLVDVRVCSNAPKIELFLNGGSQGSYEIDHKNGTQLLGHWQIPYVPGELKAIAYDENGRVVASESRRSFGEAAKIVLRGSTKFIHAGNELAFVEINAEDECGNPVENATIRIHVKVSGPGYLAGLDNGDSTDTDEYKTDSRRLFSGRLLAVIGTAAGEGTVKVEAESPGLAGAQIEITILPGASEPAETTVMQGTPEPAETTGMQGTPELSETTVMQGMPELSETSEMPGASELPAGKEGSMDDVGIPVRAIRLTSTDGTKLDEDHPVTTVTAAICPAQAADREVVWCAVNDAGIPSDLAEVEPEGLQARIKARSDGRFRLRCMSRSGTDHIRIISELDFEVSGMGQAWLDPYGFIAGGLYDYSRGTVGNGNEHGVATSRDGETQVGFHGIDFGDYGSDEITLPVFALTDEEYPIQIWEGMPGEEGSCIIADVIYQKPSVWNVYQEETYHLNKRLCGVTSICFVLHQKIHLKGFCFKRLEKAYQKLKITECTNVYGDSFVKSEEGIDHIGNNVTIRFEQMDFGDTGADGIVICGCTPLEKNAVQIRFSSPQGESVQLIEFKHSEGASEQAFKIDRVKGCQSVSFVFLPGSEFDFKWFQFVVQNI